MKDGPLSVVFGGPVAKVLDQALYVGNMEQTIPMLAESTGLDYKTVKIAVQRLEKCGLIRRGRRIANAQTYRFSVEGDLHELLNWAESKKLAKSIRHIR
jgi:DNA-binding MarR family transcriptional regulator